MEWMILVLRRRRGIHRGPANVTVDRGHLMRGVTPRQPQRTLTVSGGRHLIGRARSASIAVAAHGRGCRPGALGKPGRPQNNIISNIEIDALMCAGVLPALQGRSVEARRTPYSRRGPSWRAIPPAYGSLPSGGRQCPEIRLDESAWNTIFSRCTFKGRTMCPPPLAGGAGCFVAAQACRTALSR